MKRQYTFTIDEELFKKFDIIAKRHSMNKSLFVENSMRNYIDNGWYVIDCAVKEKENDDNNK